ncbi:hypothetical protein PA598K_00149 [Paenibacillus sp. 598K]|uniref:Stp1/IreP family PP2C-type Ser/Thr phosphatase n=1 Tax=Paenibacillus sp. 598K TaxID=1117987 RepID=UPI000FFA8EC9|nr:Stp1/IreP family PP2C-type Ser/Thr phosphatase [Paenibacillus sp. 598K]GBF71923.1 hypothetical protein PA598K_00149 [Paenibacillus sp. 598K]
MITANRSDIGRIRTVNEDRAWAVSGGPAHALAIVADGMGGHQAGDVASELAVEAFREATQASVASTLSGAEAELLIRQAILQANEVVYGIASQNEQYHNMGTTVVAALIQGDQGVIGHIGDSRAYHIRDAAMHQITEDHTLVNELLKSGQITAEEAANHPRRNVLTRALGTEANVEVDLLKIDWRPGDVLLMCSDGLSNMVDDARILETIQMPDLDLDAKAARLVELALEAGGDDNITVVLLQSHAGRAQEG